MVANGIKPWEGCMEFGDEKMFIDLCLEQVKLGGRPDANLKTSAWKKGPLSGENREKRSELKVTWYRLLRLEELEWKQRSKERWLKEGDNNTKYFHRIANMRHRVNHIGRLEVEGEVMENMPTIESALVRYFSLAFQKEREPNLTWFDEDLKKVPNHLWSALEAPFTEMEIQKAIFGADGDKSPGPDGFGLRFYDEFWVVVKNDLFELFQEFYTGSMGIGCLNATFFTLIPKKEGAIRVEDFRPISLVSSSYKMIAKALANRLKGAIDGMIESNQSAFIPGRVLHDSFRSLKNASMRCTEIDEKGW
ncbi:hypothetical protein QJS10_CPB21g01656 [Acorus calamus]|uniref:Reverse transcriptase domain-containing protein n=1 Tax=Acorus calamus TaxID=4465 RepID=A0AAV9C2V4_ACOCL|nr:hypothetical protein QJS10_CPB21g01656 [Acorus calamus]